MDLTNRGASPLELTFNGDPKALPADTKFLNGRVVIEPGETIPQLVWDAQTVEHQNYLRQTGHIQEPAA